MAVLFDAKLFGRDVTVEFVDEDGDDAFVTGRLDYSSSGDDPKLFVLDHEDGKHWYVRWDVVTAVYEGPAHYPTDDPDGGEEIIEILSRNFNVAAGLAS